LREECIKGGNQKGLKWGVGGGGGGGFKEGRESLDSQVYEKGRRLRWRVDASRPGETRKIKEKGEFWGAEVERKSGGGSILWGRD